jgi:hypothetical protein
MDEEPFETVARLLAQYSIDGSRHYLCVDCEVMGAVLVGSRAVYGKHLNLCVWAKNSAAARGTYYKSQHELIFLFKKGWRP